jgi:hypothetical protein
MLRKIMIGGLIGISAETIYLLSLVHDYPYQYLAVLMLLSVAEGSIIFLLFDKLRLLPDRKAYFSFAVIGLCYLVGRIITRVVGITIGEGVSVLLKDVITSDVLVQVMFVLVSFLANTILLFVILYLLTRVVSLFTRTTSASKLRL